MNTQKLQTLKGFRDFLPGDDLKRQYLIDIMREAFETWGFDPIETPTLEPLEIFAGQVGEDEKLFFKFKDPGGRDVALRYDQTVPTCRFVAQHQHELTFPFKRYQIQSVFRAENPQKGRYREFLQCDADIFGVKDPLADAEVIALSLDLYRWIGFKKARLLVNDRQLLKHMPYEAIVAIDKLKKLGEDGVIKDMESKGIELSKAKEYLSHVKNLKPNETIEIIFKYLKNAGFPADWYEFDPTIARSFSYSSGPIWEIEIPDFRNQSVLGGERFDQLVQKISGIDIPGTGFAVGFDRTLEAAAELGLLPEVATNAAVLVTIFNQDLLENSIKIANILRAEGISAELFPDSSQRLDKQLKYADKKGIPYVLIIGPDEAAKEVVNLKNLKTKEQKTLSLDEVIEKVSKS